MRKGTLPVENRWASKVAPDPDTGCWIWVPAFLAGDRYGSVRISRTEGFMRAHRFSYEYFIGPIPEGLVLDHLCKNTICVHPEHLEPVTQEVNLSRYLDEKERCVNGHLLTIAGKVEGAKGREIKCFTCKHIAKVKRKLEGKAEVAARAYKRPLKTHCIRNHAMVEGNLYITPSTGQRSCLECKKGFSKARKSN